MLAEERLTQGEGESERSKKKRLCEREGNHHIVRFYIYVCVCGDRYTA
jgi:hypothetical protein